MNLTSTPSRNASPLRPAARRAARYDIDIPCEIVDGDAARPALRWATDLSMGGLWLEADEPLALGTQLVVCFQPLLGWRGRELMVFAEVTRRSAGLRWYDRAAGYGVRFLDLESFERRTLSDWLRPRPLRPTRSRRTPRHGAQRATFASHPFAAAGVN